MPGDDLPVVLFWLVSGASELRLHEVSTAWKTVGESEAASIARTISWLLYDFLSELLVRGNVVFSIAIFGISFWQFDCFEQ